MQDRPVILYLALFAWLTSCEPSYKLVNLESPATNAAKYKIKFLVPPNADEGSVLKTKWRGRLVAKQTPVSAPIEPPAGKSKIGEDKKVHEPILVSLTYRQKEVTVDLLIDYPKFNTDNFGKDFSSQVSLGLDSLCSKLNEWQNNGFPAQSTVVPPYLHVRVLKEAPAASDGKLTPALPGADAVWSSFQTFRNSLYNEIPLPLEIGLARYRIFTGSEMNLLELQPDLVLRVDQEHLAYDNADTESGEKSSVAALRRRLRLFATDSSFLFSPLQYLIQFNFKVHGPKINQPWDLSFPAKYIYLFYPIKHNFDRQLVPGTVDQITGKRINLYFRTDLLPYAPAPVMARLDTLKSRWYNFGRRSFIAPEVEILLNGQPHYTELGTSLKQLLKQQALFSPKFPEGIELERFNARLNRFVPVRLHQLDPDQDLYLLPADRISFSY